MSKYTPSHLSINYVILYCVAMFQLSQLYVIIHTVLKCQLLKLSLHVLKLLYLFILTYHFSFYGSVNLQSLPLIYCIPHSHPSVHESLVLFLITWLAHCRLPLCQIET